MRGSVVLGMGVERSSCWRLEGSSSWKGVLVVLGRGY
jgi:hypothetical protein